MVVHLQDLDRKLEDERRDFGSQVISFQTDAELAKRRAADLAVEVRPIPLSCWFPYLGALCVWAP